MTVRVWIAPRIGALRLAQVTPSVLQTLYIEVGQSERQGNGDGLGSRSVRLAHLVLRQSLDKAVAWGFIRNNSAGSSLELPRFDPVHAYAVALLKVPPCGAGISTRAGFCVGFLWVIVGAFARRLFSAER
jgi:hypothetical protein